MSRWSLQCHAGVHTRETLLRDDVAGLQAFGAAPDGKLDGLAFLQRAIAVGLDGGVMDENILSTFLGQKAVPFGGIEPLDGAYNSIVRHGRNSLKKMVLGLLKFSPADIEAQKNRPR